MEKGPLKRAFSLSKKSLLDFFDKPTAEHFDFIKMLLRSKSLDVQGFSAAGYWNARRVLPPSRTPATLSSAGEASFFDSLKAGRAKSPARLLC